MKTFARIAALLLIATTAQAQTLDQLPALSVAPASTDFLVIVDVSDTPPSAGKTKRITTANLFAYAGAFSGNAATATALAANPSDCASGQYATTIAANGDLTCAQVSAAQVSGLGTLATQSGTFSGTSSGTNTGDQTTITGNAGTATALAADPADCSAGQAPTGIDASGAAQNCTAYIAGSAPTITGLATITMENAGTNTVLFPAKFQRTSSATPANGIGSGIQFETETSVGNNEIGAAIEAVTTDVTAASEDFKLSFKTQVAGSTTLVEGMKVTGGRVDIGDATSNYTTPILNFQIGSGDYYLGIGGTRSINFYPDKPHGSVYGWGMGAAITNTPDVAIGRVSAGVMKFTDGSASGIRGLAGGGAAVASATALPVPTGRVFHVTGTTTIANITATNFQSGVCITLIFDGALTMTDGSNLKLAGDFVTTADDTLNLCYDGTSWFETSRSIN